MALCRAACLRPFVSLREFGAAVRRPAATRPPCRPLAAAAAASPPPPQPAGVVSAVPAAAAPGAASPPAPKYETLSAEQQAQVDAYLDILLDWNTRMNLTGEGLLGWVLWPWKCVAIGRHCLLPATSYFAARSRRPQPADSALLSALLLADSCLSEVLSSQPATVACCHRCCCCGRAMQHLADSYPGLCRLLPAAAVRDRAEAYERHVNDSLALLPALDSCLGQQREAAAARRQQAAAKQQQQQRREPSESDWERGSSPRQQAGAASQAPAAAAADAHDGISSAAASPLLIDVGSGAGLPGIILAIARPEWEVTLLDSLQARVQTK